jgi:hypothetical protein
MTSRRNTAPSKPAATVGRPANRSGNGHTYRTMRELGHGTPGWRTIPGGRRRTSRQPSYS